MSHTRRAVEHPVLGEVHVMAAPFVPRDTPPEVRHAATLLGEHTREVLSDLLGLREDEISASQTDEVRD